MLKQEHLTVITVLIFLAPVAIFIPAFVGATQADMQEENVILEVENTHNIGQHIEVQVAEINSSSADITVYDTEQSEFETNTIGENENSTFSFANGDITVTLDSIQTTERVGLTIEYPSNYGWNNSENQVNDVMPPIVILPIVVIILSVLYAVIKSGADS